MGNHTRRHKHAIPHWLRADYKSVQKDTPVGLLQEDVQYRIDGLDERGSLNHKEAAAECRRMADYIDWLAGKLVPEKVEIVVAAMDTPLSALIGKTKKGTKALVKELVKETTCVDAFDPVFLEYLITANPFLLTPNGRFNADQRKKYKAYCFVEIEEIRNGVFLKAKKMSNGREHPITLISPTVDLRDITPGFGVALDNGDRVIIGLVNIDPLKAADLSRTFNGFYRD